MLQRKFPYVFQEILKFYFNWHYFINFSLNYFWSMMALRFVHLSEEDLKSLQDIQILCWQKKITTVAWNGKKKKRKFSEQRRKNNERIDLPIKKGDIILKKNVVKDKILDKFLGPFEVKASDKDRRNVWVNEGNRKVKHNVKNIKSYREWGESQAPLDSLNGI